MIAALIPPAAAVLALEQRFPQWWPGRFPRNVDEIERNPSSLATLVTAPSPGLIAPPPLPPGAVPHSQRRLDGTLHEPGKSRTTVKWEVTFRAGNKLHPINVVTKFQSGRGAPLFMRALRAVFERDFQREVAFYRSLAGAVPVRVARPYFADGNSSIDRVCIVLETIDGVTHPDSEGCPADRMRQLLDAAAALNAKFAANIDAPATAWIPARRGLEFVDWTELFFGKESKGINQLWQALRAYFDSRPVTLAHGDCRPGNMLFTADGVVMSDWEAINVAPVLWDFAYGTTIGLHTEVRRAQLDALLEEFLAALERNGAGRHLDRANARVEIDLLVMVLSFVSLFVYEKRLWAQGNAIADIRAWLERVRQAAMAVDADRAAAALGVAPALVREFSGAMERRLTIA